MGELPASPDRRSQLSEGLSRVRARITAAAGGSARTAEPQLIVVTKFHPAEDVRILSELGVSDVGENRAQEAAAKAAELADLPLRWHFIGQLQTNKAKSVVKFAASVHSVDRAALVDALSKAMVAEQEATGREDLLCFIQVNLDDAAESGRGGAAPADVPALAQRIDAAPGLQLAGVMAVAPLGADPGAAFARLEGISQSLTRQYPAATAISAGMSSDLEEAVRHGATHLRVGSDVLGARPAMR